MFCSIALACISIRWLAQTVPYNNYIYVTSLVPRPLPTRGEGRGLGTRLIRDVRESGIGTGVWIRWTGTMKWNEEMDWTGMWNDEGPVCTLISMVSHAHNSWLKFNHIASLVNNNYILVILVWGRGAHA